jgi:hypothetical protein
LAGTLFFFDLSVSVSLSRWPSLRRSTKTPSHEKDKSVSLPLKLERQTEKIMRKTHRENQRDREIEEELPVWDFLRSPGMGGGFRAAALFIWRRQR